MIEYRPFRNADPPALAELWNTTLAGPRSVLVRGTTLLEYFTFAKVYFDPAGLILALDGEDPVGFVHAGFGPDAAGSSLDRTTGVVCALGVLPSCRRKGVGSGLLAAAEAYLRSHGVASIVVGGQAPANPFLFGLYGGCNSPGVLSGEEAAAPFLARHGYSPLRRYGVFQRALARVPAATDPRFTRLRGQYDILAGPLRRAGWWRECVLGPVEAVEYRLQDKQTGVMAARTVLWDMDTFGTYWGESCVGQFEMTVEPALRRQGLAKYLLLGVLQHLRERSFHRFEALADLDDAAGVGLLTGLGFQHVDTGTSYGKG